jgi:hypothetical protein
MQIFIWSVVAGLVILIAILLYMSRPRRLARPASVIHRPLAKPLPDPYELFPVEYDSEGEPLPRSGQGPSSELLAKMEAAGMNTTHPAWDEFQRSQRRGPKQVGGVDGNKD